MNTVEEIHARQTNLRTDALFLKKEIEFLLNILSNCYSTSVDGEKIKRMDTYWKSFEANTRKLDLLITRIHLEEKTMTALYFDGLIKPDDVFIKQTEATECFREISSEIKQLKERFYEFMQGCNACALKTAS